MGGGVGYGVSVGVSVTGGGVNVAGKAVTVVGFFSVETQEAIRKINATMANGIPKVKGFVILQL